MLSFEQKNDPIPTRKLSILLVTRIFLLTHFDPVLVREITTPALPSFLTSCLQLSEKMSHKSQKEGTGIFLTVLQCFLELIPLHPTSFRPFLSQIRAMILPLVAPTLSDFPPGGRLQVPADVVRQSARRLFVLMSVSAPKNGMAEERARSLKDVVALAHNTADRVFRSVHEDSIPSQRAQVHDIAARHRPNFPDPRPEALALPPLKHVEVGIERLEGLLQTVGSFLGTPSNAPFALSLGELMGLLQRVLSVLPPSQRQITRINQTVAPEECESLFARLPRVHIAAMHVCYLLFSRVTYDASAIFVPILSSVLGILLNQGAVPGIRQTSYVLITEILRLSGPSLTTEVSRELSACIRLCCHDLSPTAAVTQSRSKTQLTPAGARSDTDGLAGSVGDSFHTKYLSRGMYDARMIQDSAARLLEYALTRTPNNALTRLTLQRIHETAVLSKRKKLMLASVSCMQMSTNVGILPYISRTFPDDVEVERFRRPQMPLINTGYTPQQPEIPNDISQSDDPEDQRPSEPIESQAFYTPTLHIQNSHSWQNEEEKDGQGKNDAAQEPLGSHISKRRKVTHDPENRDAVIEDSPSDDRGEATDRFLESESNPKTYDLITKSAGSVGEDFQQADLRSLKSSDEDLGGTEFPGTAIAAAPKGNDDIKDLPHDDSESSEFEMPVLEMGSESEEVSDEAPD